MKKILCIIALALFLCMSCDEKQDNNIDKNTSDSIEYYFWWEELSPEEQKAHFDSFSIVLSEVEEIIDTLKLNE